MSRWLVILVLLLPSFALASGHDHDHSGHKHNTHDDHDHNWAWYVGAHGGSGGLDSHVDMRLGVCNKILCGGPALNITENSFSYWAELHAHGEKVPLFIVADFNHEPTDGCMEVTALFGLKPNPNLGIGGAFLYALDGFATETGIEAEAYAFGLGLDIDLNEIVDFHAMLGKGKVNTLGTDGTVVQGDSIAVHGGLEIRF